MEPLRNDADERVMDLLVKAKVFMFVAFSYLLVFLIPIFLSLRTHNLLWGVLLDNARKSELAALYNCRDSMDEYLKKLDSVITNVSCNSTFRYLSFKDNPQSNHSSISDIIRAHEFLSAECKFPTLFADEYYIYLKNPDIYISPAHIFLDIERFYGAFFTYGNMTSDQWRDLCGKSTWKRYFLQSSKATVGIHSGDYILCMQPYILDSKQVGTFIVPINANSLISMLSNGLSDSDSIYVADAGGNVLINTSAFSDDAVSGLISANASGAEYRDAQLEGSTALIFETRSDYSGFTFGKILPRSYISDQLHVERAELAYFLIIAIFAGTVLVIALTYLNGKPISDILALMDKKTNGIQYKFFKKFGYMSRFVSNLIDSNETLRLNTDFQQPFVRTMYVQKLLRDPIAHDKSNETISRFLQSLNMRPLSGRLAAVLINFIAPDQVPSNVEGLEIERLKDLIKAEVADVFHNEDYFLNLDNIKLACIIEAGMSCEELEAMLADISSRVFEKYGLCVTFYVGSFSDLYSSLGKSFVSSLEAFEMHPSVSEHSVWFCVEGYKNGYYYFPAAIEDRLINAVTSGNTKAAEEQLSQIYKENIINRELSHTMLQYLFNELEGSIMKSVYKIGDLEINDNSIQNKVIEIDKAVSFLDKFQMITKLYKEVCELVSCGAKRKNSKIIKSVVDYICEQYTDPNLSLSSVADEFNISSSYLSILFKNECQENFSAFLAKKRIDHACALLAEGKTLDYIASNVGYNSVQVLRKAFNRVTGINPNDYRKSICKL
ncbi:MAG: AraC family transcriptional regulator [Clostridiales bacterium]|nr:AraC family transcriptional regulator [Clostridiales bacterium]